MPHMYNNLHTFIAFIFVSIYLFYVEFSHICVCIFKYQSKLSNLYSYWPMYAKIYLYLTQRLFYIHLPKKVNTVRFVFVFGKENCIYHTMKF